MASSFLTFTKLSSIRSEVHPNANIKRLVEVLSSLSPCRQMTFKEWSSPELDDISRNTLIHAVVSLITVRNHKAVAQWPVYPLSVQRSQFNNTCLWPGQTGIELPCAATARVKWPCCRHVCTWQRDRCPHAMHTKDGEGSVPGKRAPPPPSPKRLAADGDLLARCSSSGETRCMCVIHGVQPRATCWRIQEGPMERLRK